ncbi:MAG: aminoacyl-tRNA hydrolase [Acidobacteria bacterium]|nr:MAG: aminoacyl-tRNA hydrolase [Acidobacteriota bacterium]
MKVLVGLGNPEEEYAATRHNIGYLVAEEVVRRQGRPYAERKARSLVCRVRIGGSEALVARPLRSMNRSGQAVAALLDLAQFGTIRLRPRGGHGGHNGLLSIIDTLGTQAFPRLRIGVGPVESGLAHADFVLSVFPRHQRRLIPEVVQRSSECAESVLSEGVEIAMNRFNRTPADGAGEDPG